MKYKTVIFDFDGTLADSSFLFLDVLNSLSVEFGFKTIATEEIPALRLLSAREILTQRLGIPVWNIFKIARLDRAQKRIMRERTPQINLFPGISDLIKEMRGQGIVVGIVSSSLAEVIRRTLQSESVEVDFVHAGSRVFNKAGAIREAMKAQHVDPSRVVYVGDEIRDLEACRAVGIPMIGVGWGLNAPEALQARGAVVVAGQQELRTKILA